MKKTIKITLLGLVFVIALCSFSVVQSKDEVPEQSIEQLPETIHPESDPESVLELDPEPTNVAGTLTVPSKDEKFCLDVQTKAPMEGFFLTEHESIEPPQE